MCSTLRWSMFYMYRVCVCERERNGVCLCRCVREGEWECVRTVGLRRGNNYHCFLSEICSKFVISWKGSTHDTFFIDVCEVPLYCSIKNYTFHLWLNFVFGFIRVINLWNKWLFNFSWKKWVNFLTFYWFLNIYRWIKKIISKYLRNWVLWWSSFVFNSNSVILSFRKWYDFLNLNCDV